MAGAGGCHSRPDLHSGEKRFQGPQTPAGSTRHAARGSLLARARHIFALPIEAGELSISEASKPIPRTAERQSPVFFPQASRHSLRDSRSTVNGRHGDSKRGPCLAPDVHALTADRSPATLLPPPRAAGWHQLPLKNCSFIALQLRFPPAPTRHARSSCGDLTRHG